MTTNDEYIAQSQFPVVEELIKKVLKWRNLSANWEERYKGVTKTTKELLGFWFETDHETAEGSIFCFYPVQRLAIETLIYIVEILKVDDISGVFQFLWDDHLAYIYENPPPPTPFPKYCFKMATGSGKTFIMVLAIIWSYFNFINKEPISKKLADTFLLIAPNKIVYKRLKKDFLPISDPNSIFLKYPFIPIQWRKQFDMQIIYRSEITTIKSKCIIFLTNVQQLYTKKSDMVSELKQASIISSFDYEISKDDLLEKFSIKNPLFSLISSRNNVMVINDEAHHVHSEYLAWNRVILELNDNIKNRDSSNNIKFQLDFTATPRYQTDQTKFFEHIIIDYPLSKAIHDKIVKIPKIGKLTHIPDIASDNFAYTNQYQIQAGIKILEEYQELLSPLNKKAILFIMADNNTHADEIWRFIVDEYPHYSKKEVLLIHTIEKGSNAGELLNEEIDRLMDAAESIDELTNPYKIIVSVMMLKEGWDVKSVRVIVPLRSYKSNILVEQTLGRGLRKQFENQDEYLTVIEHERFEPLIINALKNEGIDKKDFRTFDIDFTNLDASKPSELLIYPLPSKNQYDFEIPILSGGYYYQVDMLEDFPWEKLEKKAIKFDDIKVRNPKYYEKEYRNDVIIRELDLDFSFFQNINDFLVYITKQIFRKYHISKPFQSFLPRFKKYLKNDFFDKPIDFSNKLDILKLNHPLVIKKIFEIITQIFSKISIKETEFKLSGNSFKISETPHQYTTQNVKSFKKTLFNYISFDSALEEKFAEYLDKDEEVVSFCKVTKKMNFFLYYNDKGFIRRYIPDFFVLARGNQFFMIETKGEVFIDKESTKTKIEVAKNWAKKAGNNWNYLFVEENLFYNTYQYISFFEMVKSILEGKK
ncbi:MAG: DEAD/DEAH box helicase family protein [Candidatus Helarchaeota archaeon]